MESTSSRCYIGIGSNLKDPKDQVITAYHLLNEIPLTNTLQLSTLYQNPALGDVIQPDFINAVAAIQTHLSAHELLDHLQRIELQRGRKRSVDKWAARELDLDILLHDNLEINDDRLQVPHYDLENRYFYLVPLLEIAPELILPNGKTIQFLVQHCPKATLVPV